MATIIDELIVTLGLDPSDYTKGQKEAARSLVKTRQEADKTAKEMEAKGKQAAQFFVNLRNEAIKTFAVLAIGSGVTSFVASTIRNFANLGYASESLGMTAKHLDGWQKAAERVGGSAAGITNQLKQSNDAVAAYHAGLGVSQDISQFLVWGGSTKDLKNGETYLLARARLLRKYSQEDPTKAAMLAGQMGVSGDEFNFIKQGPKAILSQVAAQEKLSNASKDNIAKAQELERKWLDVRNNLQSATQEIVISAMPALKEFGDWLLQAAKWLSKNKDEIAKWGDEFFGEVSKVGHAANDAAQAVGGWKNALELLLALKVLDFTANLIRMAGALEKVRAGEAALAETEALAGGVPGKGGKGSKGGKAGALLGLLGFAGPIGRTALLAYMGGSLIYENLSDSTKGKIGQHVAETLDAFGIKSAHDTVVSSKMAERQDYFMKQLMANGYTKAQAAGIVGSTMQESHLDPEAVNKKSGAGGIGQWLGARRQQYFQMFRTYPEMDSYEHQVAFKIWELNHTEKQAGDAIRKARTVAEAAHLDRALYERPRASEANDAKRIAYANAAYARNITRLASAVPPGINFKAAPTHQDNSTQTHIDTINIHTQATDADSIAQTAGDAFSKYNSFASQANTGLTG